MKNNTNDELQSVIISENQAFMEDNNPMTMTLKIIGGKWKLTILNRIREECPMRFGVLRKKLAHITQATLSMQLKELERDGILERAAFAETPPRVEYKLTPIGKELIPIMDALCDWGRSYQESEVKS
ncbi:helix-turn-helix domain-containing protein [Pedobacter sp. SYP-B3415]|uniref:winged helix-turn-helix transcriptional regulator n=1 Tax=Pedobacter sp. SYP-B3415 TaxID=2496641 RepID=UPI00101D790D|nr:helix-turn-helix domain-containing protein [Pedobacter sp. SYP-B3415]